MKAIRLPLGTRSYSILIGSRLLSAAGTIISRLGAGTDAVIITNARLRRLYGGRLARSLAAAGMTGLFITVPDSEGAKSVRTAERVLSRMSRHDRFRKLVVIALGGGVVGDLAGFLAAVYKRGVPFIQIPTTLLAQVDSAIGGKVALDLPVAKNLIGTFYQPRVVISDTDLLATLPARQRANGMAEIIKYGVIDDTRLFTYLERNFRKLLRLDRAGLAYAIARSSAIKARVVSRDEYDRRGVRVILNYGHTLGHAVETAAGYSGRYNHGEAVAAGMVMAADIARHLGLLTERDRSRIESLVVAAGLPARIRGVSRRAVIASYAHDKKFVNKKNRFVLPVRIGAVRVVEGVPESVIRRVITDRIR